MRILWQELKKIVRQLLGTENIFGYKSTVANQLYLLYCFSGKIYFTDRIHKRVKYFWYGLVSSHLSFSYVLGGSYMWYDDKNDLVLMLNVANSIGAIHMGAVGFPLISYLYNDHIESMIEYVDKVMNIKSSFSFDQSTVLEDAKKCFSFFLTPFIVSISTYLFICFLDVVLFFEEDKVRSYLYYAYPPPMIQLYSSFASYMMTTSVTSILFALMMLEVWSVFSLILYWNIICCDLFTSMKNGLHATTCELNRYSDTEVALSPEWRRIFECGLKRAIKEFQTATRLINHLKEFVEVIGTILVIAAFCYGVALLYISVSSDMPFILKVKCITGYMATAIAVFLFYWIGQNVDNSVSELSLAVYSTPWYRCVKIRKTVYIMLCQIRSTKNFAIFKVYTMLLNNFSRYLHSLVSYTNILRTLTNK